MQQLSALVWLKWTLFRNAMRSRKAALSRIASTLGTLAALVLALLIALVLGVAIYKILSPEAAGLLAQLPPDHPLVEEARELMRSSFLLLFIIFAVLYLMWATVPLSLGGGSQFAPGRLLLYPISLRKLFAIDYLSELTSLGSIFAIPIIFAVALGAGLGLGNVLLALVAGLFAVACGIAISKWLSTSLGALMQKRRTRGETVLALVGIVAGLSGAFLGEFVAYTARHASSLKGLRWTPPGAAAVALTEGLNARGSSSYALALLTLLAYTLLLVVITYFIARRTALGAGGSLRTSSKAPTSNEDAAYTGWKLPVISPQISAIIEKELRYAMRNAQLRIMALIPLILIVLRLARTSGFTGGAGGGSSNWPPDAIPPASSFIAYSEGLLVAGGVLYVFLILSSLACNLFAYEAGGMRALILAPVDRRTILLGKNMTVTFLALVFSATLLMVNQLVFRDLTLPALLFAALCFIFFAASFSLIGNWLSMRFPKPLQFGKRMNTSGVTALFLIPIILVMAIPPVGAAFIGYLAQSLTVKYATLMLVAVTAIALYCLLITRQGRALTRYEQEILETVGGKTDD